MKQEISTYKTKKRFSKSLKELLKYKPLSRITISELSKNCNMNRKTFYYHFDDLSQLLHWTLEQEAVDILKEYGRMNNFTEAIEFSVDYIYKNKAFLTGIYNSIGNNHLANFFHDEYREIILMAIDMHEKKLGIKISDSFRDFLSKFYANAIAGMIFEALLDSFPENKKTISDYLLLTLSVSLFEVIKASVNKKDSGHE